MKRILFKIFHGAKEISCVCILILTFSRCAEAASAYPGMPEDTQTIMCTKSDCTLSMMYQMAQARAKTSGIGSHFYILGNLATTALSAVQVDVARVNTGTPTEPLYKLRSTLVNYPLPARSIYDYTADWNRSLPYLRTVSANIVKIPKGTNGGEFDRFPTDIGGQADLSHYLRGLPQFNNPASLFQSRIVVTVIFPDGSKAKYLYVSPLIDTGLAFEYILGTHVDADGNPLPDEVSQAPTGSVGLVGGGANENPGYPPSYNILDYMTIYININDGVITVGPVIPVTSSGEVSGGGGASGVVYKIVKRN